MKKTKVAFFAEILIQDFDGASRTMFQLINRIDKERFEFLFICGVGPDRLNGFECIKLPVINLPINAGYTMALPSLVKKKIKKKLNEFSPDVIHIATPSLLGGFSLKYARKNNLPVITIYHTHFISYIDYYLKRLPFLINSVKHAVAKNHKSFYNKCDKVYVPAESIRSELEEIGIEPSKMKIWKRGIDIQLFSPDHKDPEFMQRLTGNENPTILFASRLVWEKNLETLLRVYDLLQNREVNLVVVGDGGAKKACMSRMENAIFTGKVSHRELAVLYASANVFLFTSISETYGNVVLEAMASGLPCVVADGGGSKDFIEQGVNGFKCEPDNESDYLEKILIILQDQALRYRFVQKGLDYTKQLSWEQLAQEYFNDLDQLAHPLMNNS